MKKHFFFIFTTFLFSKSITIYNNNLAYINEAKDINLSKGLQEIKYSNLPDTLIDNSLFAEFDLQDVKIISQSFYKNSLNYLTILEANLNKEVEFFTKDKKRFSGKLISINPNIIKSANKYYSVLNEDIIFTTFPSNKAYAKWQVYSKQNRKSRLFIDYLIKGISWSSNYIIKLKKDTLNLKAWAKINNKSNNAFKDINCTLLSGDLNREQKRKRLYYSRGVKKVMLQDMPQKSGIKAKALDGYYIYNIPFKISINKKEQKEFLLIDAKNIKYKKYAVASSRYFTPGENRKLYFNQVIEFNNSKSNNLSLPLPKGVVRVYSKGHYLGSSTIKNIAKDEKVKLNIGRFFDVIGEKRVVKFISKPNFKNIVTKYTLKNRSKEQLLLKIKESIPRYGNKIDFKTSCSNICIYQNLNAYVREFRINLKANEVYTFKTEYEIYY